MELLIKLSKEKIQELLLEDAIFCLKIFGVEKAKQMFPQFENEIQQYYQTKNIQPLSDNDLSNQLE